MKKKEELYYCFRYHCNWCPKSKQCEEKAKKENKRGDKHGFSSKNTNNMHNCNNHCRNEFIR